MAAAVFSNLFATRYHGTKLQRRLCQRNMNDTPVTGDPITSTRMSPSTIMLQFFMYAPCTTNTSGDTCYSYHVDEEGKLAICDPFSGEPVTSSVSMNEIKPIGKAN